MGKAVASSEAVTKGGFDPLISFMDGISALVVIFQEGRVAYANQKLFGHLGNKDVIGMDETDFLSIIAPGDENLLDLLGRARKTGQARPRLIQISEKDGRKKEQIAYPRHFELSPGKSATVLILIDPENLWDVETSFAGKPQRFMAMIDSLREWIWEIDNQCNFSYSNKASEKFLGISPTDLIGKNINDVLSGADTEKFIKEMVRSFPSDKEFITYRVRCLTKDGKPRYLQMEVFPVFTDDGVFAGFRGISHDITKDRLSQQRLKTAEKKYKTLFEGANDAIFLMSNYVFQECNVKTLEMFGCSREDIIGKHPWEFSPEKQPDGRDSKEKAIEMMDSALKEPQRFYWKHCRKDGTPFDAEVSLNRLKIGDKGKILQAIVRDISERFAYEARLEETVSKYKTLFEQAPDIRMVTDCAARILEINDAALKFGNLKREDVIGKNVEEILPEHVAKDARELFNQVMTKKGIVSREYHLHFGDLDIWQDITISPITGADGNIKFILGSTRDITARKIAELAIKEHKERLQMIQDNIDFGVIVIDRNFNIFEMNRQIKKWSPEVKIGQNCKMVFKHCKFSLNESHGCPGEKVFKSGEPLYTPLEVECDGKKKFFEFRSLPIFDSKGDVQYVMEIIDDVTEKNLIDRQLDLLRKRAELYTDLMGHDIVNFLTPVSCYLDMLLSNPTLSDDHRELMRLMFEQISKTTALIKNVRTLSETEKLHDCIERQNLKEVIENAERDAIGLFPWRSIKIKHSFPREKCEVNAHRFLMNALANIYHNAIKADAHEEVEIDTEISKAKDDSGEYYIVRIDDRGRGIPDDQKRLLLSKEAASLESMYEQPSMRTSRGMGLRIVRMIIDLSGGNIQIEDRVPGDFSQGASFIIRLPAK
ncbi:MAG: PAS domain-containing sensor histidine kinase [Thermoplasmata archaeon]